MITNINAIPIRDKQAATDNTGNVLDQYPGKEPASAQDYYKIGLTYLANRKPMEAGEQFRKALGLDPKHVPSMIGLASSSLQLGDMDSAVEFSKKAINAQPNSAEVRNAVGEIWMAGVNFPKYQNEAEARFKEAISLDSKFILAHVNLARLYVSRNKVDDAVKEYKTAIGIQPKNPALRQELTLVYLNTGSLDAAIEEAKKVIELAPQNPMYHNGLGEVYLRKGQIDQAMGEFQQAIKLEPKYAPGYKNIGSIYLMKGQPDKAIEEFNKALTQSPDYGSAHAAMGNAYLVKGMTQKAAEEYKKAISENSIRTISILELISVYNNLAYIYSEEEGQNLDSALSYAQKAKQAAPKSPDIADTLGWVHYKKGNYDEALTNLKNAAEGSPNNPIIRYHLGLAYYKKKLKDEAVTELKKSLSISDKYKGADDAKRVLAELGAQ